MNEPLASLHVAIERLDEALREPETPMNRDASIQRFEFCFELAWKAIQKELGRAGRPCASPKSCLKAAYRDRIIDDEELWLSVLRERNRTSHTYDETMAKEVYANLGGYLEPLRELERALEAREPLLGS